MRLPPLDVILSWPTPNYEDPVTRGPALLIVNCIFISFAVLFVSARLYTRICIKKWFGLDDVFIILATIFTIGLTAAVLLANQRFGWDRHIYDIPFDKYGSNLKIAFAAKLLFTAAATFTRLSLLTFYYRLVQDSEKRAFRWLVHLNVAYSVAIFITFVFLITFLCTPVHYYWMVGSPADACLDEGVATLVAGIINVTADFMCTVTPMPLVLKLSMPWKQRVAVMFLFSLGFLVTIVGCVRTWYIYKSLILETDQTWYAYPLWIAAAIEIDVGVICASAPVLRPLVSKFLASAASYANSSRSASFPRKPFSARGSTLVSSSKRNSAPLSPYPKSDTVLSSPAIEMQAWQKRNQEDAHRHDANSEDAIMHVHVHEMPAEDSTFGRLSLLSGKTAGSTGAVVGLTMAELSPGLRNEFEVRSSSPLSGEVAHAYEDGERQQHWGPSGQGRLGAGRYDV